MTCAECDSTELAPGSRPCVDCQLAKDLDRLMDELGIEDVAVMLGLIREGALDQEIINRVLASCN
jgi:hypothetical protein